MARFTSPCIKFNAFIPAFFYIFNNNLLKRSCDEWFCRKNNTFLNTCARSHQWIISNLRFFAATKRTHQLTTLQLAVNCTWQSSSTAQMTLHIARCILRKVKQRANIFLARIKRRWTKAQLSAWLAIVSLATLRYG